MDSSIFWDFDHDDAFTITGNIPFHEAGLLKLNCDKALSYLKWQANLEYKDTIKYTSEWYYDYYQNSLMFDKTLNQISEYENYAKGRNLKWTE